MPRRRAEAIAEIDRDIDAGCYSSWEEVVDLIEPFPRGDVQLEGEEIQPAAQPNESVVTDAEEMSSISDDDYASGSSQGVVAASGSKPGQPATGGGSGSAGGGSGGGDASPREGARNMSRRA